MKPSTKIFSLLLVTFTLFFLKYNHAEKLVQVNTPREKDNLDTIEKHNSFQKYYDMVDDLAKHLKNHSDVEALYSILPLYDLLPENADDSVSYRKSMIKYAQGYYHHNQYQLALKYYHVASSFSRDLDNDKYVWNAENRIGSIYARLNDYDKANQYYKICIPYLKKSENYNNLSRLYKEIGRAYMWLENFDRMEEYYNEGIKYGEKSGEFKGIQSIYEAWCEYNLNYDTSAEKNQRFLFHLEKTKYYLDKLKTEKDYSERDYSERLYAYHFLYGQYWVSKQNYPKALEEYTVANQIAEKIYTSEQSRELAKIYHKMAEVHLMMNEPDKTNSLIKSGIQKIWPNYPGNELPNFNNVDRENTFADLMELKARYYLKKFEESNNIKLLDSTLMALDLAMKENTEMQNLLILENSKFISIAFNKKLVNQAIRTSYKLYEQTQDDKVLDKIRTYFDMSKSMLLKENLAKNQLKKVMTLRDLEKANQLESQLLHLYDTLTVDGENDTVHQKIFAASEKLKTIQENYRKFKNNQFAPVRNPWIEYVVTDTDVFVYTNIGNAKVFNIGQAENLNALINSVSRHLEQKNNSWSEKELEELYQRLIPMDISGCKKITIIPDGNIAFVPFDLLKKNDRYIVEDHIVSVALQYQQSQRQKSNPWIRKALLVKPNYPNPTTQEYASNDRGNLTKLPFASEEIQNIKKNYFAWFTEKESIELSTLNKLLKGNDIFHFAGHAIANGDSCYLAMTDEKENVFTISEETIYQLYNDIELVTLSACETGLGNFKQGEGIRSLAGSFFHSGAQSIVYTLWKVDDQSTSKIMASFYKYLSDGKSKDESLTLSKRDFIKTNSATHAHPYYWAGIVVAGDTEPIVNILSNYHVYGLCIIIILLCIFLIKYFKNKKK